MASFPQLPPEIWLLILESLPPSFFQQDVRRLALSRQWYALAYPSFFRRIEFTPRVISRLVRRKSPALNHSRALLRKSLQCVNIVLDGLPKPGTIGTGTGAGMGGVNGGGGGGAGGSDRHPDPTECFNTPANLTRFCAMLCNFRNLQTVRFATRWRNGDWPADPAHAGYMPLNSLAPYLETHVVVLDLDLCGADVTYDDGTPVDFCNTVRRLLGRLRTLRLRLRRICSAALLPIDPETVTLAELTVSLYLGRVSEHNPKLNTSRRCARPREWHWASPMDALRSRMRELAKVMVEPRRAELVHLAPSGEVHVWDASTDVCVRDESEKSRKFPLFGEQSGEACFSDNAHLWE